MKRSPIQKRRRGVRRGRVVDKAFLSWIHTQPCLVCGAMPVTAHHVRELGSPLNDRRILPLCQAHHLHGFGLLSIERLGKAKFQAEHGVDIELAIVDLNFKYLQEHPNSIAEAV